MNSDLWRRLPRSDEDRETLSTALLRKSLSHICQVGSLLEKIHLCIPSCWHPSCGWCLSAEEAPSRRVAPHLPNWWMCRAVSQGTAANRRSPDDKVITSPSFTRLGEGVRGQRDSRPASRLGSSSCALPPAILAGQEWSGQEWCWAQSRGEQLKW